MAGYPRTIEPYYSLADQTAIPLYAGPLIYPPSQARSAGQVDGSVSLQLEPPFQVLMSSTFSRDGLNDFFQATGDPQLPSMPTVPSAPAALSETGDASWLGPVEGRVVGKAVAVRHVTFHLANFRPMVGTYITDGVSAWAGRIVLNVEPWVITIDGRPNLREILKAADKRGGYAVTHTCSLERRDRRLFAFARCQELLTCLAWCLWFCRAARPAVLVPVGFDSNGRAMWARWAAPRIDPLPYRHWQWFDEAYGAAQFSMLFPLFLQRYSDPVWQRSLKLAIDSYADAAGGTLQRNIVLAQVGLETLAFTHLVTSTSQLRANQFRAPISGHIRDFLKDVGIPTTIPRTYYGLRRVRANTPWDGPAAIAWLRNDIVHGNLHRVHGRRWKVAYQGCQLALWYLELAVLAVIGYQGPYRNRLSGDAYAGIVEPVPWAV
jgi:hypothetical protein